MSERYFYLPGFIAHFNTYLYLAKMMKEFPEVFYEGTKIGAIYDSFPDSLWDGGRSIAHNHSATIEEMKDIVYSFNSLGIPLRYTFTNSQLQPEHLQDAYCRMAMDIGNNGMNEVVTNSLLLEEEILHCWPTYRLVSSITKCHLSFEELNQDLTEKTPDGREKFSLVVIPQQYNKPEAWTKLLHPEKIELLVNEYCVPCCPFQKSHYEAISKANLKHKPCHFDNCPADRNFTDFYVNLKSPTSLNLQGIEKALSMGISHFKITGRYQSSIDLIEAICYYMVRPEYMNHVRLLLLHNMFEKPMNETQLQTI